MRGEPITVLLVEDDPAHAEIVKRNFEKARLANRMYHVSDGEAALDYLYHRGAWADAAASPRPGLVLLDLRLPKMDGLEVLATIRADADLNGMAVVVLTTSSSETDLVATYNLHVNSYVVKPVEFQHFVDLMHTLGYYWIAWNQYPY